jgi:hypothetical protein
MSESVKEKKRAYDLAQKTGEKIERLCNQEGWRDKFIPMIQEKRNAAQDLINRIDTDPRVADLHRGILVICDEVLGYENSRIRSSQVLMRKNVEARIRGI